MQFSVVGLPHYTIWHLYEPSVDDIRHMEEMEQERKAREAEEEERQERMKKIKDQFADPNGQWEKDKTDIQNEAIREKKAQEEKEKQAQADTKPAGEVAEAKVARTQSPEPAEVSIGSFFDWDLHTDQIQGSPPS
jgi:mannan polymerase II complex ANP1 subunit